MEDLQESKAALRREIQRRRDALPDPERRARSARVIERILTLPAYREAETVLAYASFGSELRTDAFLRRVRGDGKTLLLPRVDPRAKRLRLHEIEDPAAGLVPGPWGIREPHPDTGAFPEDHPVGFVLVPGLAFDPRGGRLGYGGGFYDRLIPTRLCPQTRLVAGAYACQMVENVPRDESDALVHLVVTETGSYPVGGEAPS